MSLKIFLGLIFTLLIQTKVQAQYDNGLDDTIAVRLECERITNLIMDNKIHEAFEIIKDRCIRPIDQIDYLEFKTIEQMGIIKDSYGEALGVKLVKSQYLDDVLYSLTFVIKYDAHGIKYKYNFYKGIGDKWYLNKFLWDDSLSELVE